MKKYAVASLVMIGLTLSAGTQAETIKPVKVSKPDMAGAIFNRKGAVHKDDNGTATTDVVTFTSSDQGFQSGVFKSGPEHEEVKGPQGLPWNEFLYFLSGSVKLTSSDGSVMTVKAGEAVTIPMGWTGHFDTPGYTKLYVTYNPGDVKK